MIELPWSRLRFNLIVRYPSTDLIWL